MLFSQIIAQNENLDENIIKILLVSAAFHDCGRTKDRDNGEHGITSANITGEYFRKNIDNQYQIKLNEIPIIQVSIEYHIIPEHISGEIDEIKLKKLCNKYGVDDREYEKVKQISTILKDADALDRVRFICGNSLNPKFLRTKTAKKESMIEFAKNINEAYAEQVINVNYYNEPNIFEDKIMLLHYLRNKHKEENSKNKEIDVPLNIVMQIFSGNKKYNVHYNLYNEYDSER